MILQLGQIAIYSKDKLALAKFLAELLDMELSYSLSGEAVVLKHQSLSIAIYDAKACHVFALNNTRDMILDFWVESIEDLEELVQKIQFQKYRQGVKNAATKYKIERNNESSYFIFDDTDGRHWRFSTK